MGRVILALPTMQRADGGATVPVVTNVYSVTRAAKPTETQNDPFANAPVVENTIGGAVPVAGAADAVLTPAPAAAPAETPAVAGENWPARNPSRDFSVFGVTGSTTIAGTQQVRVPAGTFTALVVRSTLNQAGFKFGSGTRTSYFVAGKGLVKLVFRHADRSVSTVELLK